MVNLKPRLFVVGAVIFLAFAIQLSQNFIVGADGHLHGAMTRMMISKGFFLTEFPQAFYSWFASRFSNKDFIYHLFLAPFILIFGGFWGLKIAAALATSFLFGLTAYLITAAKNKFVWFLTVWLFLSPQFVRDTLEPRPLVLAIFMTVLGIWSVNLIRHRYIFGLAFVFGLTHLSAYIYPVFVLAWGLYGWVFEGRSFARKFMAALGGYLVSFLIHPNFPNNIYYFYLNGIMVPYLAAKTGVLELGAEFFPVLTHDLLNLYPGLVWLGLVWFGSAAAAKDHKKSFGWVIGLLIMAIPALTSKRNITHIYPIFLIWAASGFDAILDNLKSRDKVVRDRYLSVLVPVVLVIAGFSAVKTLRLLPQMLFSEKVYSTHFQNVATVINSQVPPGSIIFHSNWSDSQYLIGMAPGYRYFVTLDPIYMYSYNPNLYQIYRDIAFGRTQDPYQVLTGVFGAGYGYIGKNYFGGLIGQIRPDTRFQIMYEDELGLLVRIMK